MILSTVSYASARPVTETQFERENRELVASFVYQNDGLTFVPDYHGVYFNVQDHRRVTTDRTNQALHTLWLFGSSAVFGTFVADRDTLASALQRDIGQSYRVVNTGMPAAVVSKELRLLKQTAIQSGDLVIFYDGSQDIFAPYFSAVNLVKPPFYCKAQSWSLLVRVLCSQPVTIVPSPEMVRQNYEQYVTTVNEAKAYTLAHGARWLHILQPTIYSQLPRPDEIPLWDNMQATYDVVSPQFQAMPDVLDLTHSLDKLRRDETGIYRDVVHIDARGNAVIARAIADIITPTF